MTGTPSVRSHITLRDARLDATRAGPYGPEKFARPRRNRIPLMRRAILAAALGGILLTGAACSDAQTTGKAAAPANTPSAEPASSAPDYSADTQLVCGKLEKVFSDDLQTFGTQVGKMIAYKEAKQVPEAAQAQKAAGQQLKNVGAKVKQETAGAQDPELQNAGAASADKFAKSAADTTFFNGIKSTKDLDRTIEAKMTEWLTPVAGYCA
jgi:hypothetical protein